MFKEMYILVTTNGIINFTGMKILIKSFITVLIFHTEDENMLVKMKLRIYMINSIT